MASTPVIVQTPKIWSTGSVGNATAGNTAVTVVTGNTNGSKVVSLTVFTNDTIAHTVTWGWGNSTVNTYMSSVNVAANAGFDGVTPAADLLSPYFINLPTDKDGQKYLLLKPSDTIWVAFNPAIASAKNAYVTAIGGDF